MRILSLLAALFLVGATVAQDAAAAKPKFERRAVYPLATCVVSGEKLDTDAVKFEAGGRTFLTCCDKCKAKVEKEPAPFAKKLDDAIAAQQRPTYPLDTCPVSGEKLGGMGEPVELVVDGTLLRLCCKGCVKKAQAAPAAMAQKVLDAAYAAQNANYPLDACVVTGEKFGDEGEPVSVMFGTTLVKVCCKGCIKKIEKEPARFLAMVQQKKVGSESCDDVHKEAGEAEGKGKQPAAMASAGCCAEGAAQPAAKTETAGCCSEAAKPAAKAEAAKAEAAGCCGEAATKPAAKPEAAGCCTEAGKPAAKAEGAGCCSGSSGAAPVATPAEAAPAVKPAPATKPAKTEQAAKPAGDCCETAKPAAKAEGGCCGACTEPQAKPVEAGKQAEPKPAAKKID